ATTATGKATPAADSVDPFANAVKVDQITFNGSAADKDTGILAVGADAQAAEAAVSSVYDAHELAGKNIVYLTKQAVFSAEPSKATDYLIDVAQVAASEGFTAEAGVLGNQLSSTGLKVKLANVTAAALEGEAGQKTLRVAQTGSTATAKVDFGNWFYGEKDYESTVTNGLVDGVITFSPNKDKIKQIEKLNVAALAKDAADNVTFGQNEIVDELAFKTIAYNEAVTDRADELGLTGEEHSKYIASAMETYFDQLDIASELAIAGGVFGTTLDINDQVTAALDRRTSLANLNAPRTEGFTPWVDVFGTKNEAKRIYGEGAGYEADIYGAVLGFDYTAACGGVLGLAFNVGQADGNSVGIGSAKVENDADFYGVSLYAAQTFGDFNVKADLGYTQVKNDLKMNGVTKTWKESQDADVITFGVGTEYLVKAGALNVVPHAGIRMTRIDLDDSKYGAEYETMTVYQMPLGVAFSGTFDTNGWKVAPMVDLSVVPTFGDKDAEAKYFGGVKDVVRAVDSNPIRATLGVEAQTGAWTFGVNYGLTAGSDDRLNNSLNANARYTF
ncbi:autotransporter outer membrane beta-barrel domain-containing protein, partial [Sutterella wadsworthensis]